jgi:hypothetical protein
VENLVEREFLRVGEITVRKGIFDNRKTHVKNLVPSVGSEPAAFHSRGNSKIPLLTGKFGFCNFFLH